MVLVLPKSDLKTVIGGGGIASIVLGFIYFSDILHIFSRELL